MIEMHTPRIGRKMASKMDSMVEQAQAAEITTDDVKYLAAELTKRAEAGEYVGFEVQALLAFERFGKKTAGPGFALLERMICLGKMTKDDRMDRWRLNEAKSDFCFLHEAVFAATAEARLLERDGQFVFEADEFLELVLLAADTEAHT